MKSSIQAGGKRRLFLAHMHQIGSFGGVQLMTALSQALDSARLRVFLAGEYQNTVAALIPKRHPIGKGPLFCDPANVYTENFIDPRTCHVEALVTKHRQHLLKLALRL